MQLSNTELSALEDYMLCEIDCSEQFEDDCFGLHWRGHAIYVERYVSHFRLQFDHEDNRVDIPRL